MTGVEGYVESAASGLVAGINAAKLCKRGKNQSSFRRKQQSAAWRITLRMQKANISNQ